MPDIQPLINTPVPSTIPPELKINSDAVASVYDDVKAKATQQYSQGYVNFIADKTDTGFEAFRDNRIQLKDYSIDKSDVYKTLSDGSGVSMFKNYIPGVDNNERQALTQTTSDKWLNGIQKFVRKTVNAVIGGTAGVVYGVGKAIEDGSLTSLYDNDFSRTLDDWNTKLDYQLPNYYTQQESQKGLLGQVGTANFWSDKVLGGLSFTAGAIISEGLWAYATGGASLGVRAARWGTEGLGFTRVAKGVSTYKQLLKAPLLEAYAAGNISKNTAIALGRTGDLANTLRFTLTSAGYEASTEALQYRKEQSENFYNNFAEQNGRQPTPEERATFEGNLEDSANAVFGLNMAIVGTSNVVQMGKLFELKNPINTGITEFIEKKAFGRGIEKTIVDGVEKYGAIEASKGQKIVRALVDYGKSPVTEGFYEEGGQGVIQKAAGKWLQYSYDPQKATENTDMAGIVYDSLAEQYGTKAGWIDNGVGAIIGIIGGSISIPGIYESNVKREINAKNAEINFKTEGLNTFTQKSIAEKFLMLNRMNSFAQESEQEAQSGNIVKSRIATDSVLHARFNHAYQLGENLNDVVKEAETALGTIAPEQWKEAGIEEGDIEAYKNDAIDAYSEAAKQFKKNRTYAEYVIGKDKIVGANEVFSAGDESLKTNNQEALIQSLTYTLSVGENASKLMYDLKNKVSSEVGTEQANVLNTVAQLQGQEQNKLQQIKKTVNAQKGLTKERDNLQKELLKLQDAPKETEGDRVGGDKLGRINLRLLDVETQLEDLNSQLQTHADELNSQKQYQQGLAEVNLNQLQDYHVVTPDDLTGLDDNLNKFKNLIDSYKTVNPQRHAYLTDLLDEFNQAKDIFNVNQSTALALSSGKVKIKSVNNWFSKQISKKGTMDEVTKDWLIDILQNYQKNKVTTLDSTLDPISDDVYNAFIDDNTVPDEVINSLADKVRKAEKLSPREQAIFNNNTQQVEDILKETPVKKEETPAAEAVLTPSEQLKKRLENLLSKNYNSLSYIGSNYDELSLKKPTKAEIEEYRQIKDDGSERAAALKEKLSNWKLLDSAVNDENTSVADLIDLISQLDQKIEQEEVKDITPEDNEYIAQADKSGITNTVVRYDIGQNTKGSTTVQILKDKGIYKFSHVKMRVIINSLGVPLERITIQIPDKKNKLVKVKSSEKLIDEYPIGAVFTLDNMTFTIGAGATIQINEKDFDGEVLNMKIMPSVINWTYQDVYETSGSEARKRPSDFQEDINPQAIYNIKPNDDLTLSIADDEYNRGLKDRLQKEGLSPELEKEIENSLKIYIQYKGQPVSTLKSTTSAVPHDNFLDLRQTAKQAFIDGKPFSAKVKARKVLLGSPQLYTENLQPVNKALDEDSVKKVISTGYVNNGQATLSREVGEVDLTYVSGIKNDGKKVPVVILKKGAYNIAYPVTLTKVDASQADAITAIVNNDTLSEQQKIKAINQKIIDTGIAADKRLATYDEDKIQEIIEDFSNHKATVSMEDFSNKKYNLQNLVSDVSIGIDISNLDDVIADPKLEIDLDSIQMQSEKEARYENLVAIESRISDLAIQVDNDYTQNAAIKYLDSKGNIIENTKYTDVLDEGRIVKTPQSHLEKVANVKAISEALSENLPAGLKKAVDLQVISEIKTLLKQREMIAKQTTPDKDATAKIIDNNTCK